MRFTILGQDYNIDRETIINVANNASPGFPDGRHKYYVVIDGRKYPIKQLLAGATNLDNIEFNAQYAHRILSKLGFDVQEFGQRPPRPRFVSDTTSARYGSDHEETAQRSARESSGEPSASRNFKKFAVTLEDDEDGFVVVTCPELPGCHSQGRSRAEALRNVTEAIRGYVASMKAHGEEVPNVNWEVVEVTL